MHGATCEATRAAFRRRLKSMSQKEDKEPTRKRAGCREDDESRGENSGASPKLTGRRSRISSSPLQLAQAGRSASQAYIPVECALLIFACSRFH